MNEEIKQAQKECPRCHKTYTGYPAISRVDNETPICPECGREEAIMAMVMGKSDLKSDEMAKFNRGDRVEVIGVYLQQWGNIRGTVTYLHGDPPNPEYRPEDSDSEFSFEASPGEVWVVWDQPCEVGDCWMKKEELKLL